VGLVHHQARGRKPPQQLPERCAPEPLGRDVEQFDAPGCQLLFHLRALGRQQRGVERRRRNALRAQPVDLVFHQGDERGDHDGRTIEQQRGKLEAKRLTRARRHHGHDIAAREHGEGGFPLARPEVSQPEPLVERAFEIGGCRGCGHLGNLSGPVGRSTTRKPTRRRFRATAPG